MKTSFPRSSNIASAEYDANKSVLTIEFKNGGMYLYSGVPKTVFDGLIQAPSAGRYFASRIRDKFATTKLR
jgi:lysyl-tRNA synthetase class 2